MTAASVSSGGHGGGHGDGPAREWRDTIAGALVFQGYKPGIADALLPVVAGIVAGELRAMAERADTWSRLSPPGDAQDAYAHVCDAARARADEIDPS